MIQYRNATEVAFIRLNESEYTAYNLNKIKLKIIK